MAGLPYIKVPESCAPRQIRDRRGRVEKCIRTYDWPYLADTYRKLAAGEVRGHGRSNIPEHLSADGGNFREGGFYGATTDEVVGWLNDGYDLPALDEYVEIAGPRDSRIRRRRKTDDPSGDFDYTDYLNGDPEYFRTRDRFRAAPGIHIEFSLSFNCGTDATLIAAYGRFVGSTIRTLQARGFDISLIGYAETRGLVLPPDSGGGYGANPEEPSTLTRVILSEFGQVRFEFDWSVVFSPGGFRHLFFLAFMLPGEGKKENGGAKQVSGCLGSASQEDDWGIHWERDSRTLRITTPPNVSSGSKFPDHELTTQLQEICEGI